MKKALLISMAIASSTAATLLPTTVQAGASANFGMVSTYVFRGLKQTDSAGQGGIDYEADSGVYAGAWASQVGSGNDGQSGLEYDAYFGWSGTVSNIDLSVGYTGYFYTNGFDNMYNELNLSATFGAVSLAINPGKYDTTNSDGDSSTDYYNVNISGDIGPIAATLGYNDWDTSNSDSEDGAVNTYLELSYSKELFKGVDGSITYSASQAEDASGDSHIQNYLIVGISTAFDI
jgi:uncharacterized protein (TIGR02001 family)